MKNHRYIELNNVNMCIPGELIVLLSVVGVVKNYMTF